MTTDTTAPADLSQQHGLSYDALPYHLQAGAKRYLEDGVKPGRFLCAVLANDFVGVSLRADHLTTPFLASIARWLYNELPPAAWGSVDAVDTWIVKGGLRGDQK